jgi:hypothetical protein
MSLQARRRLWNFFEALFTQELTEGSDKAATPAWIKTPLLKHQQSALAAALRLENAKSGIDVPSLPGENVGGKFFTSQGILGDRVGSGKSLTALALVKAPLTNTNFNEYILRNSTLGDGRDVGLLRTRSQLTTQYGVKLRPVTTALFIVPHALMSQWQAYVSNDTYLKAKFIAKRQDALTENLLTTIEKYDVLFVSSTMWNPLRAAHSINEILWSRVFIDEADSISISTAHDDIHGLFYWFISASWMNLLFANGAYFNISYSYTPLPETPPSVVERVSKLQGANASLHIQGCKHMNISRRMCSVSSGTSTSVSLNAAGVQSARIIIHSSEPYIQSSFAAPTINHMNIVCETPANIRVLDSFISADMLEMLNAGDVTGALQSIGITAHTEEEITKAVTASLEVELDNAQKTYEYKKTITYSSDATKAKALEVCEQKIASVKSRITAINERIRNAKEQTCPICYSEVTNAAITPCCTQLFCFGCLCESLKRVAACPLCRERIEDVKSIQVVGNTGPTQAPEAAKDKRPNKQQALVKFLQENPTAKVLMFSGYDATFTGMETKMRDEKLTFATLNGSNARINKLLREFNDGKHQTLFLNARNMGAGLNIETATHVVLFHKMAQELESQIIGRANRLGRSIPINVVHLLHENEIANVVTHV